MFKLSPTSLLARCSTLTSAVVLSSVVSVPSIAATTINFKVFSDANLIESGFHGKLLLMAEETDTNGNRRYLLSPKDEASGNFGVAVKYEVGTVGPLYQATVQVDDPKKINFSYFQLHAFEVGDEYRSVHIVKCQQYSWLQDSIKEFLSTKKPDTTETINIDAYMSTKFRSGWVKSSEENTVIDNSTCLINFKINGENYPKSLLPIKKTSIKPETQF